MVSEKQELHAIFNEAIVLVSEEDRARYLDEACGGDLQMRARVEALLHAHSEAGGFFGGKPPAAATEIYPILEQPGTVIGAYKLLQQIGEGGMGVVFMAAQTEPIQRTVALKIIKPGMDTRQVIGRFEAERQALALMEHSNIARVLDAGATDTGRPYFVMELVKGVPITEYCDGQQLSVRQRLELMTQVCQAVQHAHQKGIIHRDIKPSNVLVAEYDGKPVPKVIDFGVAKATAQRLTERTMFTQYGQIVGTFEYMSPEQARFNQLDIDTRSDIYSLGVLLYEVLAGSTPLEKERLRSAAYDEVLRIICEEEPPKPSTRLSSSQSLPSIAANRSLEPKKLTGLVRGELDWIVMKCLEKDRNRRYETANGLATDLQRYLHDEAVTACPPSAAYRLRKFVQRNKATLATAALVLFFLVLLGGGAGWTMRDRAVRQAALEQGVTSALADVEGWHQRENWPEAMAAVKHAEALLASGEPSPALTARVAQWRTDLDIVARLDELRLSDSTGEGALLRGRPVLHDDYRRAFGSLDIDIDSLAIEESAARIRARPIRDQLIAALDSWVMLRMFLVGDNSETARNKPNDWHWRPLAVAHAADTDELRNRVRRAVGQHDQRALLELARSSDAIRLPASTLELLVDRLRPSEISDMGLEIELLKRAQQARPDDFYINYALATSRPNDLDPSPFFVEESKFIKFSTENDFLLGDEAISYARAAVALRPNNAWARANLALLLLRANRLDEALAAGRKAIRLGHDDSVAYSTLGNILQQQGKLDEALAAQRKASELQPADAHPNVNIGRILSDQGKHDEAIAAYHKAIELAPANAAAYVNLGISLAAQGKLEEAIAAYRKAIKCDPRCTPAYHNLGNSLRELGQFDDAVAACRKAIELDPDVASAHSNLGIALAAQGSFDEAVAAYHEAIERDPNNARRHDYLGRSLVELGQIDEALLAFRKAIELDPELADSYNDLGWTLYGQQKFDEAVAAIRKAIELRPDYSLAYGNLGVVLRDQGKLDEAVAAYRKVIQLEPALADSYYRLGYILHELGKFEESIAAFRKAIELKPDYAEAYNDLGVALLNYGKLDDAVAAYRKSLELNPQNERGYANLGYALQGQGKLDEAIVAYREAIERQPTTAVVYENLGNALQNQGKIDEAIAAYQKAIELQPSDDASFNNLAMLLATAPAPHRDPERALELATRAVELAPDDGSARNTLGIARYRAGQWQPAIESLEKSMKLRDGGDANDWFFLALAHWQLGHKDDARTWYDKSVAWMDKNAPKNEELRRLRAEAAELLGITEPNPEPTSVQPTQEAAKTDKPTIISPPSTDD